ncbi:Tox-REase-5 domain-containing protein [Myxococcaceae bacterium GXIMD 01537]
MTPRWAVPLVLVLLVGCGGARARVVRLETGEGKPLIFSPRGPVEPVELEEEEFQEAMRALARDVRPAARPLEEARRLFGVPPRSGTYLYESRTRQVVPLDEEGVEVAASTAEEELTRAYLRWCGRKSKPGDCLRLLEGRSTLNGDGKYALAMALAMDSVWDEAAEALEDMVDPQAVLLTVVSAGTVYFMLWVLPEPVSKLAAAGLTLGLVGYLGLETVGGLIGGWVRLVEEVDGATTFDELRAAGERYGEVLGVNATRIFIMLTTAAVGRTGAHLAEKLPGLPGAGQAMMSLGNGVGVRAEALAQVETVVIHAESVVITLAPGAVAMTARGASGESAATTGQPPPSGGPGKWVEVNESMPERARDYQAQVTGAPKGSAYRVKAGGEEADFDGFQDGVLLEAKGPGYTNFVDKDMTLAQFFKGAGPLLKQAERQSRIAGRIPVRWLVAEEKLAAALKILFNANNLKIEVVWISPAP